MGNLVFKVDPSTQEAYRVEYEGAHLARIPTRVFDKLYQNVNQEVELKKLLEYAYQEEISDDMLYYRQRSLDTMLCVVIKPFAEMTGFVIFRKNGKSIMLIKEEI